MVILKDYLESQRLSSYNETNEFLPEIMQTWRLASQSNNENLLSSIPAVLALLLRVISNSLDLLHYGIRLGKTLLQKSQQDLIKRGLIASKHKEYLISPVLRLMRELSMIDGGSLSNNVFKERKFNSQILTRNLNLKFTGEGIEGVKKPSVRTNTARLILQWVKHLSCEYKLQLLDMRGVFTTLIGEIQDDPPFLVRDILETLKAYIVEDEHLPRVAKTKIFTSNMLLAITSLYRYNKQEEKSETPISSICDYAHEFLMLVCTTPNLGVLLTQSGLYPKGLVPENRLESIIEINRKHIDLGIDSIEWIHKYTDSIPVRNVILSEFIRNLRPWTCIKQSELILLIFKVAPELVAEYFLSKINFSLEPKLTATWVGYMNLAFRTIQLSLPEYFGNNAGYAHLPPPLSITLENILPRQFNPKLLAKCLSPTSSSLATFLAVRHLCAAFRKLQSILGMCREASKDSSSSIWTQYASRISEEFSERCPAIHYVITAYRRLGPTDLCQREVFSRLIALYYEVTPRIALESNSGVSAIVGETLMAIGEMKLQSRDDILRVLELENILRIANFFQGVRWCRRCDSLSMSPFLAMLKLSALATPGIPLARLRSILLSIVEENQILQTSTTISALDCFILSLRGIIDDSDMTDFYDFMDACIVRCATTPTKYIFKIEELSSESKKSDNTKSTLSLFTLAMEEQWPFYVKSVKSSSLHKLALFISQHLAASVKIKEDSDMIRSLSENFANHCPLESNLQQIIRNYMRHTKCIEVADSAAILSPINKKLANLSYPSDRHNLTDDETGEWESFPDNNALVKWRNKDVEDVIEEGHMANLIMLLSSTHLSIRKEASTNIFKLADKIKDSNFVEKEQIWLLLSEIFETAKYHIDQEPMPATILTFGCHAVHILKDPSHHLFPKINNFLSRNVKWNLNRIPLLYNIMDEAPNVDREIKAEREWLVSLMYSGLRSKNDLEIFRKNFVFEKLFSLYNHNLSKYLQKIILKLLMRACKIDNGSTTLITRFGTLTWLEVQQALATNTEMHRLYEGLLKSCSQKRIRAWSRGAFNIK